MTSSPAKPSGPASDIGWVVGHSYIVYGPLIHGCSSVLYEGKPVGTPDAGAFWRVIQDYQGQILLHRADGLARSPQGGSGREACEGLRYVIASRAVPGRRAGRPRHCRLGAEGVGRSRCRPLVADGDRLADRRQSGWPRHVADQARLADRADAGLRSPCRRRSGEAACPRGRWARSSSSCRCRPAASRPSTARTSGCGRATSRSSPDTTRPPTPASSTTDGYITILGRTDDIINVAGHRLSTGGMEEVVASHPDVAECAVLGVKDEIKGESPAGSWC